MTGFFPGTTMPDWGWWSVLWPDPEGVLRKPAPRERTRVLDEPRGPATEMRMSPEQTRAAVEPEGFDLEQIVELPPYHYGAVFVRGDDSARQR